MQDRAGTLAHKIYGQDEISERHRHRYEFNREYEDTMVAGGLKISGSTPDGTYVEIVEIPEHPYFIGCQFHPEFKSKPLEPHPLFKSFIGAPTPTARSAKSTRTRRKWRCFCGRRRLREDKRLSNCVIGVIG